MSRDKFDQALLDSLPALTSRCRGVAMNLSLGNKKRDIKLLLFLAKRSLLTRSIGWFTGPCISQAAV